MGWEGWGRVGENCPERQRTGGRKAEERDVRVLGFYGKAEPRPETLAPWRGVSSDGR